MTDKKIRKRAKKKRAKTAHATEESSQSKILSEGEFDLEAEPAETNEAEEHAESTHSS